jgi:hypothetical protein
MENTLIPVILDFMRKEKIRLISNLSPKHPIPPISNTALQSLNITGRLNNMDKYENHIDRRIKELHERTFRRKRLNKIKEVE